MIFENEDEMLSVDESTGEVTDAGDTLEHYGMPRRSGRYPWGSGKDPYQRTGDFLSRYNQLKSEGKTESEIAEEFGIYGSNGKPSPSKLRSQKSIASNYRRSILVERAKDLQARGLNPTEIGEKMGMNESSVRSLLNAKSEARMNAARNTANLLKEEVDKYGKIDVGEQVERSLGVTRTNLDNALMILEMEGYPTYGGRVPQVTNKNQQTTIKVLCPPGTEHREIYNYDEIHRIGDVRSQDGGETFDPVWTYPKSLDSSRVQIRYADQGGKEKDGVVEIRPGVEDVSLGGSHYAQVRILVDGTHYIKGMAVYGDPKDFPPGVDLIFNTNKGSSTPMKGETKDAKSVLKPIDDKNPDNPFGALIKRGIVDPDNPGVLEGGQRYYYDENGEKQLSVINKKSDEGDWDEWKRTLSSQFLSKQNKKLVEQQLRLAKIDRQDEFEEIMALENPTVKKHLLMEFASSCDSAATHLAAAALPRQRYQVILPIPSLKDTEVYAPNYEPGETVALVRFPHGGTFEIPILKVNNNNAEGKRIITPGGRDAVGINSAVAERLSGADFDGDTVMVIPLSGKAKITSTNPLKGLKDFDPKAEYQYDSMKEDAKGREHYYRNGREFKLMKKGSVQREMGSVSNLITDMTILGATDSEKARAVRHSMVVIDAYKHKLDYKQSEIDNDIQALKNKYQGRYDEDGKWTTGAATIVSQASSPYRVGKRRGNQRIDPETGRLYWDPRKKIETYVDSKGKIQQRTIEVPKMSVTDDAMTLVSKARDPIELLYADYANSLKGLANDARKEYLNAGRIKRDPEAAKKYAPEVEHLEAMLAVSESNAPKERQAQLIANAEVKRMVEANPSLATKEGKKERKKISQQALSKARAKVGAHRTQILISEREWEAIQAGAISENTLNRILRYAGTDQVRAYATPKDRRVLSPTKQARIRALSNSGYTNSDIAKALGVSVSTVLQYLK